MCYVYTAGYEGRTIEGFIEMMKANHIERVVDVREIPISRKKGFSKSIFNHELESSGIDYVHIRGLGSPKNIRAELYQSKDYETFFQKYRDYAGAHFGYIQEAWEYVSDARTCLVCFEKNFQECHRSVIADLIYQRMPNVDGVVNL